MSDVVYPNLHIRFFALFICLLLTLILNPYFLYVGIYKSIRNVASTDKTIKHLSASLSVYKSIAIHTTYLGMSLNVALIYLLYSLLPVSPCCM